MNNSQIARRMQSVRPSPTAVISDQVRALEAAGKPVINLGEGELDFATPAHISYAGIEAIVHHQTKYTAVSGTAALKEAIAAKFARKRSSQAVEPSSLFSMLFWPPSTPGSRSSFPPPTGSRIRIWSLWPMANR